MKESDVRVIVAHPGKQHSFRTAIGLEKNGLLENYVTSVYNKKYSITYYLEKLSKGDLKKKLHTRFCSIIPPKKVRQINELLVIITLFLNRFPKFQYITENWNYYVESFFYKKLMRFVRRKNPDALIVYNGSSNKHFSILKNCSTVKIMDMSIAKREYIHEILQKEINCTGISDIRKMHMSYWDPKMIKSDIEGCNDVDYFFVPSEFVKNSLLANGIPKEKIKKIPYGVDVDKFHYMPHQHKDGILRLLYVGNISYRKGSHRLLDAVSHMDNVELYLAGTYDANSPLYLNYTKFHFIKFLGFVTRDKLNTLYGKCDVFVLPSLCEGMAMVGLEAMAAGLPLLCTFNTGVNDVVENGKNGFVYKTDDNKKLSEYIMWFKNNKDQLPRMSEYARHTSLKYTWDIYYENLSKTVIECVKEKSEGK